MMITVSIVDMHKPKDQQHVGTYSFEIDYPGTSHFDFFTIACPVETENELRPQLGRLMKRADLEAEGGWTRVNSAGDVLEDS